MLGFILKLFRNNTPYDSFDEAYEALQTNTTKSDGEVIAARYTDDDGDIQSLVGIVYDDGETRYVSVHCPTHDFGEYELPTFYTLKWDGTQDEIYVQLNYTPEYYDSASEYADEKYNEYGIKQGYWDEDGNELIEITDEMWEGLDELWDNSYQEYLDTHSNPTIYITTSEKETTLSTNLTTLINAFRPSNGSNKNVATLDLNDWNTSNVTDMGSTFSGCSSLTTLDVSNWDTSKVTSMYNTFYGCSGLTTLDVSNWDTSNVTNLSYTFSSCRSLTTLDVSNWDTSKVTNMYCTFWGCRSLTTLDVSNWDTSKVTSMSYTFYGCSGLTTLDVSNWDTSKVTSMSYTFYGCSSLTGITVTNCSDDTKTKLISALSTSNLGTWVENNGVLVKST